MVLGIVSTVLCSSPLHGALDSNPRSLEFRQGTGNNPVSLKELASCMLQKNKQKPTSQSQNNNKRNSTIVQSAFSRDFGPKVFEPLKGEVLGAQSLGVLRLMGSWLSPLQ